MKKPHCCLIVACCLLVIGGCSVFGKSSVETASYDVTQTDGDIEVRQYRDLILVSTTMKGSMYENEQAFGRLFDYISGANQEQTEIAMTSPVLIGDSAGSGRKTDMTAPVLLGHSDNADTFTMSFVLPETYTYETAPRPTRPDVQIGRVQDLTVAAIEFGGTLNEANTAEHRQRLEQWIADSGFEITGDYKVAGYDPPWTLPYFRRNEVMIPVGR